MAHEDENKKAWEKGGAKYNRYGIVLLLCHYHRPKSWPSIRVTANHTANISILVKKPPIEVWGACGEMVVISHCVQTTLSRTISFHLSSSDAQTNSGTEHTANARSNGYDSSSRQHPVQLLTSYRWPRWRRKRESKAGGGKDNHKTQKIPTRLIIKNSLLLLEYHICISEPGGSRSMSLTDWHWVGWFLTVVFLRSPSVA